MLKNTREALKKKNQKQKTKNRNLNANLSDCDSGNLAYVTESYNPKVIIQDYIHDYLYPSRPRGEDRGRGMLGRVLQSKSDVISFKESRDLWGYWNQWDHITSHRASAWFSPSPCPVTTAAAHGKGWGSDPIQVFFLLSCENQTIPHPDNIQILWAGSSYSISSYYGQWIPE